MKISKVIVSNDRTKKYYFTSDDFSSIHIEACLLNLSNYGYIICVSSQVGCAQTCKFCAAGNKKFIRDLSSAEIVEQIELIVKDNPQLVCETFQVTYMGSGEPLSNYTNVFQSIDCIREQYSNLSKVNISTTAPMVSEECFNNVDWLDYKDFLHIQYSLHFTRDVERRDFLWSELMKISDVIEYLNRISALTGDMYKINYIPFANVNDDEKHAEELVDIFQSTQNAILKISKMSDVISSGLMPSEKFDEFVARIRKKVERLEVFDSNGTDVNAGCGQFYNDSIL